MVEERIDEARSRQDEVDTNEQVFRELQRRADKGKAQSLGAAWLDGVSVSQGHLVVLSTFISTLTTSGFLLRPS